MHYKKVNLYRHKVEEALKQGWSAPVTCEISLCGACNLDCSFCIFKTRRTGTSINYDLYVKIIENLKDIGVPSITFTGNGEALLHPMLNDIIKVSRHYGMKLGLVTNGTLLDMVYPTLIKEFEFIRVSLNAASSPTYENITGMDMFDKVISNIRYAKANGARVLGISYVVVPENIHEIRWMGELAKQLGVDYAQFKTDVTNPLDFKVGNEFIQTTRYKATSTLPCAIASLIGVVSSVGKVYYCCQYRGDPRYELGDLNTEDFMSIWKRRKHTQPVLSECPTCRYSNYAREYEEVSNLTNKEFM